jgi:hypothetical protein
VRGERGNRLLGEHVATGERAKDGLTHAQFHGAGLVHRFGRFRLAERARCVAGEPGLAALVRNQEPADVFGEAALKPVVSGLLDRLFVEGGFNRKGYALRSF